jgi:hypothetical protein
MYRIRLQNTLMIYSGCVVQISAHREVNLFNQT